jgi:hypothetical protein
MTTREVMPLTQMLVSISDPRSARQVRHDLSELLTVAVCAVLCSADEFSDIEAWAKERIDWLRGFLVLEHGIPSHDTFGRVFAALNPHEFEAAFRRWVSQLVPTLDSDTVVAIDGKSSRRSTRRASPSSSESGPSGRRRAVSVATTSVPCPPTQGASRRRYAVIGKSKTDFIGASMSSSTKTNPRCVPALPPTTLPSFGTS